MGDPDGRLHDQDEAFWEGAAAAGLGTHLAKRALAAAGIAILLAGAALVVAVVAPLTN